jgi:hypothetical protein
MSVGCHGKVYKTTARRAVQCARCQRRYDGTSLIHFRLAQEAS